MMAPTGWLGGHPEAGELLCFADRSLSAMEHEQLAAHLTDCEHCQRELSLLEAQARSFSAAMATLGSQTVSDIRRAQALTAIKAATRKVDRRRPVPVSWMPRLAAASVIIVGGSLLAGPGLALMRTIFVRPVAPSVAPPVVVNASNDGSLLTSGYARALTDTLFAFSFEKVGGGTLVFRRHDASEVAIATTGTAKFISGPSPVIQNDTSSSPAYIVTLPSFVKQVSVSVGGRPPVVVKPETGILYDVKGLADGKLEKVEPKKKP